MRSPTSTASSMCGIAEQDRELLAAEPGRDVVLADGAGDRPGNGAQHLVADRMPVGVVQQLEPVDVDHEDADRVLRPPPPGEQRAELVEVAPVREPRERIGRGARLGLAMRVGPRERGRCLDRRRR